MTGERHSGMVVAVNGDIGTRTSPASTGTAFKRRTRGRGASAERRGLDEKDFGMGSVSVLDRGGGRGSDAAEELVDDDA